jgi:hypothetical protein
MPLDKILEMPKRRQSSRTMLKKPDGAHMLVSAWGRPNRS